MWWFFYAVDLTFLFGILTFLQQLTLTKKNIFEIYMKMIYGEFN